MRLSALLRNLPTPFAPVARFGAVEADPVIRGLAYDSRQISPGELFIALPGSADDGHDYLGRALELGAAALLVDRPTEDLPLGEAVAVQVPDTRRALGFLATAFFGVPSSEMDLVGITGTNGKTSTSYMTESILESAGINAGLIGTVDIRYGKEKISATNTTPESLDLQRTLRAMLTHGVSTAVLEVSSHGLELGRVAGCHFKVGAFTNLSQDHLDFHGDMESYLASKTLLFRDFLDQQSTAVINIDDNSSETILEAARKAGARILRCSRHPEAGAEIALVHAEMNLSGTQATVSIQGKNLALQMPLVGDFNLENLLIACGIASALGISDEGILRGIADCPQVPGRMERIQGGESAPTVIVDYAHTPDAMEKLLETVRDLASGRLITVFGCGGDRDRAKRPLMAQAVDQKTDLAIATSDNPRTEDPDKILHDVETGLTRLNKTRPEDFGLHDASYTVLASRREAIERAIEISRPEDTVVLAGKGHEDYQIIGTKKFPFDDRIEAQRALNERGGR
ncbi:MAG: UDP-N-acetylmuramoyl-L-alanyl-D-glutamate--2,6-diaminopimelate ligase [Myxococcota bacterium]|nr:UDP-N-acetylmuramoyl-L-alanyl-D-glutamate--2,6-diaminopimelate ligase [Myxococcota bacterium]